MKEQASLSETTIHRARRLGRVVYGVLTNGGSSLRTKGRSAPSGRGRLRLIFLLTTFAVVLLSLTGFTQAAAANIVKVEGAGSGSGTVTSTGGETNLNCTITAGVSEGECEVGVAKFASFETTATAAKGSEFTAWEYSGGGISECEENSPENPCTTFFASTGEEGTLTATFEPEPNNIVRVEGAGTGSGTVTSTGGITELNCTITGGVASGECEVEVASFPAKVVMPVTPDSDSKFVECSYSGGGLASCSSGLPKQNPAEAAFFGHGEEGVLTVELKAGPPAVSELDPASGPVEGGNTVRIRGRNLLSVSKVVFGSTPASSMVELSPTELEVTAPPGGPAGVRVDVRVIAVGGTSAPRKYTYLGPPHTLTIAATGEGAGSFECSAGGSFGPCLDVYFGGQSIVVRATAAPGTAFGGWTGCDNVFSLTDCLVYDIAVDTMITAAFDPTAESPSSTPPQSYPSFTSAPDMDSNAGERRRRRRAAALRRACVARARKAHNTALRAAERRSGKARARNRQAANRGKARAIKRCSRRFRRQRGGTR